MLYQSATEIRRRTITRETTIAPTSLDVASLFALRSSREWRKADIVEVIPWEFFGINSLITKLPNNEATLGLV
jgi:hypothetical protein